ncbi:hypothetical protein PQX77_021999 [Marasmius sp. AFHP31]|nr:hypothetical protein PQX77_021999 [Marasmius sp. AFHP31]
MIKSSFASLAIFATLVASSHFEQRSLADSETLRSKITLDALLDHAQKLQDFAYASPGRNRLFGSSGHNDTIGYIYETLTSLGDYYTVTLQPFSAFSYVPGNHALTVDGELVESTAFNYSPNGNATAELVPVANSGCKEEDYPPELFGKIGLVIRGGGCDFGEKSVLAGAAGALGVIIYNNVPGGGVGSLPPPPHPKGDYIPTLAVMKDTGLILLKSIEEGATIMANVIVDGSVTELAFTNNVIAETKCGNHDDVLFLGAHSDSVAVGPGINDDGSGSVALLEIAKQLTGSEVTNAIRFAWWSAEEAGLLGSVHWVTTASQEELDKVRLYLNFDMIASPNYALNVYDGDGSQFNMSGPPGSAEAEQLFHDYFKSIGLNSTSSELNGRSDYGPFLKAGIACGGLDTGAEGHKTVAEAEMFGGEAGVAYDVNYHQPGDTMDNLAHDALEANAKAIAHAVAVYSASFDDMPARNTTRTVVERSGVISKREEDWGIYMGDLLIG